MPMMIGVKLPFIWVLVLGCWLLVWLLVWLSDYFCCMEKKTSGGHSWVTPSLTNSLEGTVPVTVAVTVVVPADGVFGGGDRSTVMPSADAPEAWKVCEVGGPGVGRCRDIAGRGGVLRVGEGEGVAAERAGRESGVARIRGRAEEVLQAVVEAVAIGVVVEAGQAVEAGDSRRSSRRRCCRRPRRRRW